MIHTYPRQCEIDMSLDNRSSSETSISSNSSKKTLKKNDLVLLNIKTDDVGVINSEIPIICKGMPNLTLHRSPTLNISSLCNYLMGILIHIKVELGDTLVYDFPFTLTFKSIKKAVSGNIWIWVNLVFSSQSSHEKWWLALSTILMLINSCFAQTTCNYIEYTTLVRFYERIGFLNSTFEILIKFVLTSLL